MLGAIIGDIIGSRFEFNNTERYDFNLFTPECDFTDDTICTIGIADAILRNEDYLTAVHRWCRKYPHPKGAYGTNFLNWVMSRHPKPYGSFGNGAAMRVSPVAWAFNTLDKIAAEATRTAEISHNHPEGIKGAVVISLIIYHLLNNDIESCNRIVEKEYGSDWHKNLPAPGYFDVTCQGCVPLCWKLVNESYSFEDAIRLTVSYGGDTDTTGAITGSIAEVRFGIPDNIRQKALSYLPDEMLDVINRFEKKFSRHITH